MFTIITGAQFGDEGKGKIVDLISGNYDLVVRFQGGNNAGHTVKVGEDVYKLHLIPSGFLLDSRVLIGPGTVVNPEVLAEELDMLAEGGINLDATRVGVDAKASIIMPYHIELDGLRESQRTEKIGTTKRGIGFAYIDKVARDEVRMGDLADKEKFLKRLEDLAASKEAAIKELGGDPSIVMDQELIDKYVKLGKRFASYVTDVSYEVNKALDEGKNVLAEGAQGTHLDVIHGTQKFVTSSCTIAGSACANIGVGPTRVDEVLAIVKAYITRVGEGPLPTELFDDIGKQIQDVGGEFGTTTGRSRRCGWFDLPLLRKAIYLNGYTSIALTKLDVLSNLDMVKVCVAYELDGKVIDYPPEDTSELVRCKPVYEDLQGWDSDLTGVTEFNDLPQTAQDYVTYLEDKMGVKIDIISVGPAREQTFRK
ncbi:MAG: adenylosuccinate synthase [Methanolobus sp.]|jgi:adenylosuccinate synthase|uniref:adenylosuccinate synthase n=1 Tax=Methanolobus sp. TaxID=1874737 RepID=UPI0024AC4515|nr:adenylosuccinate synthase [Methanolobus sp.]MDI3485053.1 adenylosuccinate synthase [Methanolobus sp.]MDK2831216.1 adenylosuccinate synthase [Methanolobus sp.]MDK2938311.1 adenylosuccinate synthase [Methanolobus sp.]